MEIIKNIFKNLTLNVNRLSSYGFEKGDECYCLNKFLMNGIFTLHVYIFPDETVKTSIIDNETGEPYTLIDAPEATGPFIGKLRLEYSDILADIAQKCFSSEIFKGQSKRVAESIKEKYGDELEFLWEKFPENAIVRRRDNAKWYAAFLKISKQKLGLDADEIIDILDFRADSNELEKMIDGKKFFAGYHMNKKHWCTICLDETFSDEEILSLIDISYLLAKK